MASYIGRRKFLATLGGAAAAWPLAVQAQQPAKTIGFLGASTRSAESQWIAAFVQRLRELGWIDGRNIVIEYRWAEGRDERFAEIAAEFVRLKVGVIVTWGTPTAIAAKQATSVIPIVVAAMGNPLGAGIVASLARPGGNVTGLSGMAADLASKRLELLREVVPSLRRLAVLANIGNPAVVLELREVQSAAGALGLEVVTSEIRQSKDIAAPFKVLKSGVDALYVCTEPVVFTNVIPINILAAGNALVCNPHPSGAKIACHGARLFNQAIHDAIGIDNLITIIQEPTLESAEAIFGHRDVRLLCVTGGAALARAWRARGRTPSRA